MNGKTLANALRRCFRDPTDEEARRVLAPFADVAVAPKLTRGSTKSLRRFARSNVGEASALLQSDHAAVRHAAAFTLGHSDDAGAVRPLIGLLVDQRDWFDHDFAYGALAALGDEALPELCKIAKGKRALEAREAVQAMGQSEGDALPWLRKVRKGRKTLPEHYWLAYYNLRDARGLPDVMDGLEDPTHREDALEAVQELVSLPATQKHSRKKRRAWAERLAPYVASGDVNHVAQALVSLGWLGDERQLDVVCSALVHDDDDVIAAATNALARLSDDEAKDRLIGLLDDPRRKVRVLAAAALEENRLVRGKLRKRVHETLVDGVMGLTAGWAPERAFLTLERSRSATRALLDAMASAEGRRLKRGADALVQVALFRARPRAVYERMRDMLRGAPRRALDDAWEKAIKRERRIQRALARVRARAAEA